MPNLKKIVKSILPSWRNTVMTAVLLVSSVVLWQLKLMPEGNEPIGTKEKAVVLTVDDSQIIDMGYIKQGSQNLEVEVLSGKFKGQRFRAANELRAQMELDKVFVPGDTVLVGVLNNSDPASDTITAQDYYRIDSTLLLFALFALLLLIFGGWTGFSALLSFVFSCLVIWKVVIPLCLQGYNALLVTFLAVVVLSVVIILLVAGLTRKGFTALAGSLLGVLASCLTGWIFTSIFKINGAVMPYSQTLLHCWPTQLSLSDIYIGAIFLSSSGAVMDLAMDVASGQEELSRRRPELQFMELLNSGIRIGRSVVGTMTTTLLLAYSGGYLTLMMAFAAQGVAPIDFINNPHVASEAVKTLVGSFGLVLVAPFTALVGAWIFGKNNVIKINNQVTLKDNTQYELRSIDN